MRIDDVLLGQEYVLNGHVFRTRRVRPMEIVQVRDSYGTRVTRQVRCALLDEETGLPLVERERRDGQWVEVPGTQATRTLPGRDIGEPWADYVRVRDEMAAKLREARAEREARVDDLQERLSEPVMAFLLQAGLDELRERGYGRILLDLDGVEALADAIEGKVPGRKELTEGVVEG